MKSKEVSKEEVKKIALLSGFDLSGSEIDKFSVLLTQTLKYMDILEELDTSGVEETFQVTGLANVFQELTDSSNTLSNDDSVLNSSDTDQGLFVTKGVFDR